MKQTVNIESELESGMGVFFIFVVDRPVTNYVLYSGKIRQISARDHDGLPRTAETLECSGFTSNEIDAGVSWSRCLVHNVLTDMGCNCWNLCGRESSHLPCFALARPHAYLVYRSRASTAFTRI